MLRIAHSLVVVTILAGLTTQAGEAQTVPPLSNPVGTVPAPNPAPACPLPSPPPPPACAPYEDCNGPLLRGDPLLDRPGWPPPGWFTAFQVDIAGPHIKNQLTNPVTVLGMTNQVHLPTAALDWTGSPWIEVGYRFPEGFGEVVLSYHSLDSEGRGLLPNFDILGGAGALRSRLNVNEVGLDYASREYSLGPHWDMKWKAGARFSSVFFDSRAIGPLLAQRTSNDFQGAGPHLGLDLHRELPAPGLARFGRFEAAALLGKIKQEFEEVTLVGPGILASGGNTVRMNQTVPVLNLQTGLSWIPDWRGRRLRLAAGYELEVWWYLGQTDVSRAELTAQGVFLRAELGF